MENEPTSERSRFPVFRALFRVIFNRRAVFAVIAIITLIALLYAEENFRGRRAWARYRKSAEARGVSLDFAKQIPPPIPENQNAAITPLIQAWFPKPSPDGTNRWPELVGQAYSKLQIPKSQRRAGQDDRRPTDFVVWQRAFADARAGKGKLAEVPETERNSEEQVKAAAAILEELKIYEPALAELRVAAQRPLVRYPVEYKLDDPFSILLPHLAKIKGLVQELKIQASAELAVGQTDRAFEDVRLMLWLCDSLKDEGFLICQLVRIACEQIALQPIWEGLVEHKWSESQLKEIQERMLRVNFADSMSHSINAERAGVVAFIQTIIKRNNLGEMLGVIGAPEGDPANLDVTLINPPAQKLAGWLVPRGWIYFEMANLTSILDGLVANGWDSATKVFYPQALDDNEKAFEKKRRNGFDAVLKHQALANLLLPALAKAAGKFSRAQATASQVALACALERYYKTHHAYPDALAVLVPQYIASVPNEAVSLTPMRYLRTPDGYVLYSAGWDQKDDGGALLFTMHNSTPKGDWVWRMGK